MVIETSDSDFEEDVIEKSMETPVLVDFWAPWCGPCQILGPILEEISKEYKDRIIVTKLNVEENQIKSSEYKIMSIPSVKIFKQGKIVDEFVGLKSERDIKEWIDSNI